MNTPRAMNPAHAVISVDGRQAVGVWRTLQFIGMNSAWPPGFRPASLRLLPGEWPQCYHPRVPTEPNKMGRNAAPPSPAHLKKLYTVFLEYRGGTYISQISSDTPSKALLRWAQVRRKRKDEHDLPDELRSHIKAHVREDPPIALIGVRNVWCFNCNFRNRLVLIHLISTD
jgi:hypothetical protein